VAVDVVEGEPADGHQLEVAEGHARNRAAVQGDVARVGGGLHPARLRRFADLVDARGGVGEGEGAAGHGRGGEDLVGGGVGRLDGGGVGHAGLAALLGAVAVEVVEDQAAQGAGGADQVGDQEVGDRRAAAGDQVVADQGVEAVAAGGDVVEVGGRQQRVNAG